VHGRRISTRRDGLRRKAYEAREAVQQGAREIDMVIQLGALRAGDDGAVFDDIRGVVEASGRRRSR